MCPFEMEEVEDVVEEFDDYIKRIVESQETVVPDSKNEISRYVECLLKKQKENKYLKEEYKPFIKQKHIDPIDEKIKKNEEEIEFIRQTILAGLEEVGENSVTFPNLAKVAVTSVSASVIYPEDEAAKEFLAKIVEEDPDSKFLRKKYELNKKEISSYFKENESLPFPELEIKEGGKTIRVSEAK